MAAVAHTLTKFKFSVYNDSKYMVRICIQNKITYDDVMWHYVLNRCIETQRISSQLNTTNLNLRNRLQSNSINTIITVR